MPVAHPSIVNAVQAAARHAHAHGQPRDAAIRAGVIAGHQALLPEWAGHTDLPALEAALDQAPGLLHTACQPHTGTMAAAAANANPTPDPDQLARAITSELQRLYGLGAESVRQELAGQAAGMVQLDAVTLDDPDTTGALARRGRLAAVAIITAIWQAVGRRHLTGVTDPARLQVIGEQAANTAIRQQAQAHAPGALAQGREDQADEHAHLIAGARYSSVLDRNRCSPCAEADDGVLRKLDDPVRLARRPPNPDCHGWDRCRCMEIFQLADEAPAALDAVTLWDPGQPRDPGGEDGGQWVARGFAVARAEDVNRLRIPPAWTDVFVSPDPDSPLQAVGRDAKGREQRIYSDAHHQAQAAAKFARIRELRNHHPAIEARAEADALAGDDTAGAVLLISRMGLRPGSDADTGAERKAYGATNLLAKHVEVDGDTVRLRFVGKKGVDLDLSVRDGALARVVRPRLEGKAPGDRLLDTDERRARQYLAALAPGFKLKDLRTLLGTVLAQRLVASMPVPSTRKQYTAQRREIARQVSARLGNTPAVALSSYIDPAVFGSWDAALARREE